MRVTILTVGTRGDLQPYIALGRGLQSAGIQVRLATNAPYKDTVEGQGLEFFCLASDTREVMQGAQGRKFLESGENVARFALRMIPILKENLRRHFRDIEEACRGADAILHAPLAFPGWHVAEAMGVPSFLTALQPALRTRAFPAMPLAAKWSPGGAYNLMTHVLFEQAVWQALRSLMNRWRRESLDLPPLPFRGPFSAMMKRRTPVLYGFSRHVVPKPPDWPDWSHLTGYWYLDRPDDWAPPAALVEFLASGPPPVYLGYSSMIPRDPDASMDLMARALRKVGARGILGTGWMAPGRSELSDDVYVLDEVPHDWLFPRVSAVVHHGGAGTVGTAIRAGVPAVVVPFYGDQPFWAARVAALGLGPRPIPARKLTADKLAHSIRLAVTDGGMRSRASELGEKLRGEDGVGTAVGLVAQVMK